MATSRVGFQFHFLCCRQFSYIFAYCGADIYRRKRTVGDTVSNPPQNLVIQLASMKLHRRVLTFWFVFVTLDGLTALFQKSVSCNNNKTLSVIGLFGKTVQYDIGDISEHGAQLAVNDINSRSDILPGYKIALLAATTQVRHVTKHGRYSDY